MAFYFLPENGEKKKINTRKYKTLLNVTFKLRLFAVEIYHYSHVPFNNKTCSQEQVRKQGSKPRFHTQLHKYTYTQLQFPNGRCRKWAVLYIALQNL